MANSTKYWKGLEQLENDSSFVEANKNEFSEELPVADFLQDQESLETGSTTRLHERPIWSWRESS